MVVAQDCAVDAVGAGHVDGFVQPLRCMSQ